jgi:DNA primase small subunit
MNIEHANFEELLEQYYLRLFPHKRFFRWLNYGGLNDGTLGSSTYQGTNGYFSQREFSFTLMGTDKSEIYLRYQSFSDDQEFKKELIKLNPIKLDIGAVFSFKVDENREQLKNFPIFFFSS